MCKSVPQIEAVFTRTSTSVGPIKGTATVSICRPLAACIFRNAFIVPAIYLDSCSRNARSFAFLAPRHCREDRFALPHSLYRQPHYSPTQIPMLAHPPRWDFRHQDFIHRRELTPATQTPIRRGGGEAEQGRARPAQRLRRTAKTSQRECV